MYSYEGDKSVSLVTSGSLTLKGYLILLELQRSKKEKRGSIYLIQNRCGVRIRSKGFVFLDGGNSTLAFASTEPVFALELDSKLCDKTGPHDPQGFLILLRQVQEGRDNEVYSRLGCLFGPGQRSLGCLGVTGSLQ